MKYLTLVAYLLSYTTGFVNLGFTAVAWLRTRDKTFLWYLGFLLFFTFKVLVFNAEFFLEVFQAEGRVRDSALNLALVSAASLGFNGFLLLYLRSLTQGGWSRARTAVLGALAVNPVVLPMASMVLGPLWTYGLETACDTVLLALLTWLAWTGRPRARGALFRQMLTALVVLNLIYFPLALFKGLADSWEFYDPGFFQLANGYYFAANLVLAVLLVRHLFLAAPARPREGLDPGQLAVFGISPREAEVIGLLNRGLGNREIGERLFISAGTVKNHIYKIYQKTGVQSRVELLRLLGPEPNVPNGTSTGS